MDGVHLNDIGTFFSVQLVNETGAIVNVSQAVTKQIIFKKADGTRLAVNAVFKTDGTDGIIGYTSITGTLNVVGTWSIQGVVSLPTGNWSSEIQTFYVHKNL
jgi:hypothetical protein